MSPVNNSYTRFLEIQKKKSLLRYLLPGFVTLYLLCILFFFLTIFIPNSASAFSIGDKVKATASLNVRSCASTTCSIIAAMSTGSIGTISNGPYSGSGYTWWYISWDSGVIGYSVQDYLTTVALSFTGLSPSTISTSTAPYDATLSASGSNFNNVNKVSFSWSGSVSGSATWNKGDTNWNAKVTVNSDTSMTLLPRVVETNPGWSGTSTWTVTLTDSAGATASRSFTVTYSPLSISWSTPPPSSMTSGQNYTVSWNVSGSSAYNIQVLAKPLAKLDANNNAPTSGDTVTFTGVGSKGSSASCGINSYSWDFDDGTTGSGSSVTHSFTSYSGTTSYTVQLTVTDCIGQIDSTTMSITVTGQAAGTNNLSSKSNDPVNLATGNYTYEHTDLNIPGRGILFEFNRSYNSKDSRFLGNPLGFGWTHSYNIRLSINSSNNLDVLFGDGRSETYIDNADGTYHGETGVNSSIVKNNDGTYILTTKEQLKYNFDNQGKLLTIIDKNSNTITLNYDASGNLDFITDTVGRTIDLV